MVTKAQATFSGLTGNVSDVAISPDEQLVAAAANYGVIVWSLASGKIVLQTTSADAVVKKIAFSPDSRHLLGAGRMKDICVINIQDGRVIRKMTGQTSGSSYAEEVIYLPDSRGAVSAGWGGTNGGLIRVWRVPD